MNKLARDYLHDLRSISIIKIIIQQVKAIFISIRVIVHIATNLTSSGLFIYLLVNERCLILEAH